MNQMSNSLIKNGKNILDNKSVISGNSLNQTKAGTTMKSFKDLFSQLSTSNRADDIFFAESEATRLKTKVLKLNGKTRTKLWERKDQAAKDEDDEPIMKRITEIRQKVRQESELNDPNYEKKSKHIKSEDYQAIIESSKILQEQRKISSGITMKASSLSEFISDNKEITLKNFLINLLEGEQKQIFEKEKNVREALDFSHKKLIGDEYEFDKFTGEEKEQHKKKDDNYTKVINQNKVYQATKKELQLENKTFMDDLGRNVYKIKNLKQYGKFTHMVVGEKGYGDSSKFDAKLLDEPQTKDRDITKEVDNILTEFNDIVTNKVVINCEFFSEPDKIMQKFTDIEEGILKLMAKNQEDEKNYSQIHYYNQIELEDLMAREEVLYEEYLKINNEVERDIKVISIMKTQTDGSGPNQVIYNHISGLIDTTLSQDDVSKNLPKKLVTLLKAREMNFVKDYLDSLKILEGLILKRISQVQHISVEDPAFFKRKIEDTRLKNKNKKQSDVLQKNLELDLLKKEKNLERMNKVIVKGRRVITHMNINKGPKVETKKKSNENENSDNNFFLFEMD